MSKANIYELEINFSNACTAGCQICSRYHGSGGTNNTLMGWDVFNTLMEQLKDINIELNIQTSGNGEAFLNPNYLDYISIIRKEFPQFETWTYNNFSQWTPERTRRIVDEGLFDRVHVRIDSLEKWIFEKASNLNQETVFNNLIYFLEYNKTIPVTILYNNVNDYYERCKRVLGKRPARDYFYDTELGRIKDEEDAIWDYFTQYNTSGVGLDMCRIGHSLWGERSTCQPDGEAKCPKFDIISSNIWVCPNGDTSVCCYDDRQSDFICGNIMEEHLGDIFNGERRRQILDNISKRVYKGYPCVNPNACRMGD